MKIQSEGRRLVRSITVLVIAALSVATWLAPPAQAAFVPVPQAPRSGISFNGTVYAVAMGADVAYVGGDFTSVTGTNGTYARSRLAAINLASGAVTTFRADANGRVRALALNGSALFVGGDFTTLGGSSRGRLAEVNATTGAVASFRLDAGSSVRALASVADRLYVGGQFTSIGGVAQGRLAAVNLGTRTLDTGFRPVIDNTVRAVTTSPDGSTVYAGGDFLTVNASAHQYLVSLTRSGALNSTVFGINTDYQVLGLDTNDNGSRVFAAVGGAGNQVASFNPATGSRQWRQRADGDVQAVAYYAGNVYFGFHEGFELDLTRRLLVADANSGALEPAFRPTVNSFYGVWALAATSRGVVAGGEFTTVSSVSAGRFAFFDANAGSTPPTVTTVVASNQSWRYFDTGQAPSGWSGAGFTDSSWKSGRAQLGYGDGDEATVIGYGPSSTSKYPAAYFRTTFTWNGATATRVVANLLADDGAVVYLNGTEVARDNMPTGTITYNTLAASGRSGTTETTTRSFTLPTGSLRQGTNVVAVEVHQDTRTSSDLSMQMSVQVTTG